MHVYFNRPKKLKKKAYISIAKFTGFSVPFCCHVYSPYLFIFQRPLTPLNPVIPVFLEHGQTLLKKIRCGQHCILHLWSIAKLNSLNF